MQNFCVFFKFRLRQVSFDALVVSGEINSKSRCQKGGKHEKKATNQDFHLG